MQRASERKGLGELAKQLASEVGRARVINVASEMAFWLFLSLIPIAAVAGLVLARFAMHDSATTASLLSSLPVGTRDLITTQLAKVSAWNGGAVAPIAALTFLWLASSGVHAIFDGIESVAHACPRAWWKKRALAFLSCVAFSVGVALIAFLGAGVKVIEKFLGKVPYAEMVPDAAGLAVRLAIGFAIAVGIVAGLYRLALVKATRERMPLLPGAIAAVVVQTILGFAYGTYVRHAGDGGAYQAGLAVIGITLMALYLLCISLLVGVAINVVLGQLERVPLGKSHPQLTTVAPAVTEHMVRCDRPPEREVSRSSGSLRPSLSGVA